MAGLGYKDFTAGAVLTAAQVDGYLMEQSVMNFAGTAARNSALASVLSAGQMAHVGGGTVTVYDGSAWQQVYPASAGLTFVAGTAFSAVSSVSVNSCFTSTYTNYQLLININSASVSQSVDMRLRVSGTDNSSSNYYYNGYRATTSTSTTSEFLRSSGLWTQFRLCGGNNGTAMVRCEVMNPQASVRTGVLHQAIQQNATDMEMSVASGIMSVTTSYDGFTLLASTGTITGTLQVYGYRNS